MGSRAGGACACEWLSSFAGGELLDLDAAHALTGKMRLLVLGGTAWLGGEVARAALEPGLETEGRGHYVGCNVAVRHFQGSWWGRG